jgi:glyoxylase-like metal-dependent hydrolase (beta-lactamase superfamily II)
VEIVKGLGGLSAIAISHPHYYGTMVEWGRAFGGVPVHLHAADRQWIMRPDPVITLWEGDTLPLASGVTLVRCGGHFAGGTVLHWAAGGEGRGALLSGDVVQVIPIASMSPSCAAIPTSCRCRGRRWRGSARRSSRSPST